MSLAAKRQIVIGDVRGELAGLNEILRHAELIDDHNFWSGGQSVLIQTGDVIDRGPHSLECVRLFRSLQSQAPEAGEWSDYAATTN